MLGDAGEVATAAKVGIDERQRRLLEPDALDGGLPRLFQLEVYVVTAQREVPQHPHPERIAERQAP